MTKLAKFNFVARLCYLYIISDYYEVYPPTTHHTITYAKSYHLRSIGYYSGIQHEIMCADKMMRATGDETRWET